MTPGGTVLEILPSIDLRDGRVVRLRQGDFSAQTSYEVVPERVAEGFALAGARIMHLVDLDGAKAGEVRQGGLIASVIKAAGIPVQVGGGVRSEADIEGLFGLGAARVVVGTAALENWEWFGKLVSRQGMAKRLVLAIDARDGVVATRGWTAASGRLASDIAAEVKGWPLAGLLYTDVAVDGMLTGPNLAHTAALAAVTDVPVIASGGVGSLADITNLRVTGAWGVIVGKAIYEGRVKVAEALQAGGIEARG